MTIATIIERDGWAYQIVEDQKPDSEGRPQIGPGEYLHTSGCRIGTQYHYYHSGEMRRGENVLIYATEGIAALPDCNRRLEIWEAMCTVERFYDRDGPIKANRDTLQILKDLLHKSMIHALRVLVRCSPYSFDADKTLLHLLNTTDVTLVQAVKLKTAINDIEKARRDLQLAVRALHDVKTAIEAKDR